MGRRGPFRWGLALAVVLVAQQSLANEGVCRSGCRGDSKTFKYAQGTTYKYNYDGKIDITLSSAEGQVSSTEVKATVLLTQLADCNQLLRLQNVQILGPNGKKHGQIPDVDKPVRINFNDGHVEDSICTVNGDTQNSLNLKRAIASLFQANFKSAHETDVFGLCPTDFAQHKDGDVLVIQKSRNLNKCSYRENIRQDFFNTVFNLHSEIKSSPILNGDYSAKLRVKGGILEQANAVESYLYVPFSVGNNGAKAQVTSKLQLAGTSKENPNSQCSKPSTILFENPHPVTAPTSNVNTILSAVKDVVKTIDIVVGEQTAKEFVTLIKTIRAGKQSDLLAVYNQVKSGAGFSDKVAAKKVFLDALLQSATSESVEVAITLLKSNEFNEIEKKLVYAGLSFVRHSSESLLNAAGSLLSQRGLPYEVYLAIGNIAGRYCQQHSCENVDSLNKLTQKLIQKLGDNKAANKQEENEMVYVLKSLANFGYLSDSIIQKIISIAQDKQAPNRLRVVALESYLADPCKDKLRNSAVSILQDIQQDSEIRIKAYLAAAQCPNAKVASTVKNLLEKEPSYQVGGFIVSHIRSIKASANPDKDLAKQFLSFSVPRRFPIDFRKYSYNGEFSYAIDTLGLAASSETNIIYSQDSFLPRSTSLNLTAEVFGHTFNFLEIQTRQENLDKLVEHYFGPKGILKTSSLGAVINENGKLAVKTWDYITEKLNTALRYRRDISKAEIDSIGKAVQIKDNVLNKDLDLDLSVKAFGSEIFFSNLNVYQEGLTPEAIIDKIMDGFVEGLDKLKKFKETLRSNLLLLDVEFDYPTGLGFPLRLAAEGTTNIQVEAEGNIDLRAIISGGKTQLKVKLIPSANVEVTGRLTLDALVVENGLKVVSTLYSAVGGELSVSRSDLLGFDIKYSFPIKEQKLLAANHEIIFHSRDQAGQETDTPLKFAQQKDFSICVDQLSPFIGLVFCADLNGPNLAGKQTPILPFPLAGDAKLTVNIENEDISYYQAKSSVDMKEGAAELVVVAVGKNNEKKTEFTLNAELHPDKYFKVVLNSPLKTAYAEGRITENQNEKSVMAKFGHDQNEFYGKIGILISGPRNKLIYKPILEYKVPEGIQSIPIKVSGQLVAEETAAGRKYTFDKVKISLPNNQELSLNGNVGAENDALYADVVLSNGEASGVFKGRCIYQENLIKLNAEFTNTINPVVNFNLKAEAKKETDKHECSLQLIHGPDLSSKTNKLSWSYKVEKTWKGPGDYSYGAETELSYPLLGLGGKYEFKIGPKLIEYEVDFQYNEVKLGSELEVEIHKKQPGDLNVEFGIYGLDHKVKLKIQRQIQGDVSNIDNELEVNGKKLQVKGKVRHQFKSGNVDIGADLTVTLPTHPTPFKVNSGLKYNPNDYDAHHKVTSGNTVVVDAFIKGNKQGNANGSFKVNIKNYLVVNGQLKATKGSGIADVLVDVQRVKQQLKLDSTFKIQPNSVFDIDVTIYPSFGKDKSQQIKISTHNNFDPNTLDSKSSLNLLGKKIELNVNGKKSGNEQIGKLSGEVELTLPNDLYVLGKLNSNREYNKDLFNGDGFVSLEYRQNKNTAGRKLSVSGTYKNTNPQQGLYDVAYVIAADDSNGHNINYDIYYKKLKQGQEQHVELGNKLYGSVIKEAVAADLKSTYGDNNGQIELSTSYGNDLKLKVGGAYSHPGEGKPCNCGVNLQLQSPNVNLKSLNLELSGSVLKPRTSSERLEIKCSGKIAANRGGNAPEPIIDFKGDGSLVLGEKDGSFQSTLKYGKEGPIAASAAYNLKENGKRKEASGNAGFSYGQGKKFRVDGSIVREDENQYKIQGELDTPFENYQKTKFTVQTKRTTDQKRTTSSARVNVDGKEASLDTDLQLSDLSPVINIKLVNFAGKSCVFLLKNNKASDKEFNGELKYNCGITNFLFEADWNANVDNVQDFSVKANVNSPPLKINKIYLEAHSKQGGGDRKIQITIKSAGKNWLSGSTNYQTREEQGKFIAEGSGTFKIKEQSTTGNFKFLSQQLSAEKNKEEGFDVSLDVNLGKRSLDFEVKLTDKQVRLLNSYCETPAECSKIDYNTVIKQSGIKEYNEDTEVVFNLKNLGVPFTFDVKASIQRKETNLDHTIEIRLNNGQSKYQYNLYVHPTKAGISLTTPKRVVSLEGNVVIPQDVKQGGKFSGDISFYLDKKNAPNKKSSIEGWLNVEISKQNLVTGEAKLSHPGLPRTLTIGLRSVSDISDSKNRHVTVNTELDIFNSPNQKIVSTYKAFINNDDQALDTKSNLEVKSSGLGINVEYSTESKLNRNTYSIEYTSRLKYNIQNEVFDNIISLKGNKEQINFLLRLYNTDILKSTSKLSLKKEQQTIDSEISSYDNNPIVSHLDIKNLNTLLFTIGFKNTPKNKLQFNAGLIPGQIADIRSDHITGSAKVNLFHTTVRLDEANFLKPDYNVNSKEIETILGKLKTLFSKYIEGLLQKEKEWENIDAKQLVHLQEISKALPNSQPIKQYYNSELEKIRTEITQDDSIKPLVNLINRSSAEIANSVIELLDAITQYTQALSHSLQTAFAGVINTIEHDVIPLIKQIGDTATITASEITKSCIEILSAYLSLFNQFAEKYQPQIKEIAAIFGEIGQEIGRFIQSAYLQSVEIVYHFVDKMYNELKTSAVYEELKVHYDELVRDLIPTRDGVIGGIVEIAATIKDLIPPEFFARPEIVDIIDLTVSYIEKKLKQEPVNDFAILERIIANEISITKKILDSFSTLSYTTPSYDPTRASIPIGLDYIKKLPKLVAVKFSPIAYILKEDPSDAMASFILSLIINPTRWLPPFPLFSIIVQGQYIFTFDGKLITFPGNCKYLLARDAVNGNFTLAGTYVAGALNSITLADNHDSITIKKGGQILLNNAAAELPTRKPELAAYRDYEMIYLTSTAGITVSCLPDLEGCSVAISGFYHGQLKGLLGNGNNEPYDDLTIPNGKIVTNEGEFGNSYKIGNCQPVNVPKQNQPADNAACNKLFGWDSSLALCYPFVKTDNFKAACAQGQASKVKNIEATIAKAYVAACWEHNIPIAVPSQLLKCSNSDKQYDVGDLFSVKLPGKAADIVLIVDTSKENEGVYKDFFQPLVAEIAKSLQTKGVSDVQFHLITYNGENQWPSHTTVSGKLTFKNKAPNLKFSQEPKEEPLSNQLDFISRGFVRALEDLFTDLKLAFGQDLRAQTFTEAYYYPFRSNALKSIIVVNTNACELGKLEWLQKLRTLLYKNNQISLNLITPLKKLSVKDSKKTNDIIGFNDNHVFTISQAKKKPEGTAELYKELDYDDYCVDFTIKNRGNVFGTNNFLTSKADVKKQFVHVAAHNIVKELVSLEEGLDCECKQVNPYNAFNVCKEAYSKEKN